MTINMLNAEQERENNRDVKLKEYLLEKKKEYETYAPFNDEVQLFLGNMGKLDPFIPVKGKKGVLLTKKKKEIKAALATDVNKVCTSASAYALSIGDYDLLSAVRFRASDIVKAKDGNVVSIVTTITDAITPLLNEPAFQAYEITAVTLSSLTEQAEAFSNARGKAAVIDIDSSHANGDINKLFKAIRANIGRLHLLIHYFDTKNPNFVTGFNTSAAVDYSGIRHSGVEGIVINPQTGDAVEGVTITGEGKNKMVKTDNKGVYKLVKLKIGDMKITITAPGYETQVADVKIIRGKISELNISLRAKILTLSATA